MTWERRFLSREGCHSVAAIGGCRLSVVVSDGHISYMKLPTGKRRVPDLIKKGFAVERSKSMRCVGKTLVYSDRILLCTSL